MMRAFAMALCLASVVGCNDNKSEQRLAIGSPCASSGECGTGAFFCDVDQRNGYCQRDCTKDGDCPSGAVCVGAGMITSGACHRRCDVPADCRVSEGYGCGNQGGASHTYCAGPKLDSDGGVSE